MSEYANFVSDFPARCRDLLEQAEGKAKATGREVTLSIAIASCGLVIPMERLKTRQHGAPHPFGDLQHYPQQAADLKKLMVQPFLRSPLQTADFHSWHGGTLGRTAQLNDPDSWQALANKKLLDKAKLVSDVLDVLRNALAHGNIVTRGSPEIREIIFVSEFRDPATKKVSDYSFVTTSPGDFNTFLRAWFDFIASCNMQTDLHNVA